MLETGRIGRVTSYGNIYIFLPHDGYTFTYIVSAIALNLGTRSIRISYLLSNCKFAGEIVKIGLYIGKAIDTADNLCGILVQTVQDTTKRILTNLVRHFSNLDGAFSSSKRLVTSQECKALSLLTKQTGCQVTMTQTYFTILCYRSRNTERLQTYTNSLSAVSCSLAALLQSDSSTNNISPLGILKADALSLLASFIRIQAELVANCVSLFNIFNTVSIKSSKNLLHSTVLILKINFSNHILVSLFFTWVNKFNYALFSSETAIVTSNSLQSLISILTFLDSLHELAKMYILVTDNLVVLVKSHSGDVAFSQLQIACTFGQCAIKCTRLATQTF